MLSNLLWWPWAGIGDQEPPPEGEENPMGGIRPYRQGARVKRGENPDEEELIAVVMLLSSED